MNRRNRLWLAWKVLTGRVVSFRADAVGFRVIFDFTGPERSKLAERERADRESGHPWTPDGR